MWRRKKLNSHLKSVKGEGSTLKDQLLFADVGLDPTLDDQDEEVDGFALLDQDQVLIGRLLLDPDLPEHVHREQLLEDQVGDVLALERLDRGRQILEKETIGLRWFPVGNFHAGSCVRFSALLRGHLVI